MYSELKETHKNLVALYNKHDQDVNEILEFFTDDFTLYFNGHPPVSKKEYPQVKDQFLKIEGYKKVSMKIIETEYPGEEQTLCNYLKY